MGIEAQRLMSKTQHYRKVTKPLLERKRRARMNLYLDELKDLIVDTMEAQGEHVTKLEKADILEMTVQYLKTKKRLDGINEKSIDPEKFQAGFSQAAYEVSKVFASFPGLDLKFGTKLMQHLGYQLRDMKAIRNMPPSTACSNDSFISYSPVKLPDIKVCPSHGLEEPQGREVWRPW